VQSANSFDFPSFLHNWQSRRNGFSLFSLDSGLRRNGDYEDFRTNLQINFLKISGLFQTTGHLERIIQKGSTFFLGEFAFYNFVR